MVFKADNASPVGQFFCNDSAEAAVTKADTSTDLEAFGRFSQNFPLVSTSVLKEEKFHMTSCLHFLTIEAGRENSGVVHDKGITRFQHINNRVEMFILHFSCLTVDDEEFGGITFFKGRLGNQFLWQVEIKISCIHIFVHSF
ncbi:Uncharacterised protein [Streptococcus pneumoniae]|nr:Uncharacterised protein [Streptococcus pneumoniae]